MSSWRCRRKPQPVRGGRRRLLGFGSFRPGQIGGKWPWPRYRHFVGRDHGRLLGVFAARLGGCGRFSLSQRGRLAYVPLAKLIAVAPLGEIEMHMLLVITVRTRSENG